MPNYDVAFVDSIASAPGMRLDLHTAAYGWSCLAEGTTFPPPELERVTTRSMLTDGESVPSAAYRNRTISLSLELPMNLDPDAATLLLQALSREIDRPTGNILRYRPDTSTPVFFRTFRSGPEAIDWDPMQRRYRVQLLAEPFAYGLEETLSAVTVYNDPVEGTTLNSNPFFETTVTPWTASGGASTFVRSTAQFHEGAASGLLTPDGVTATVEARAENVTVTPTVTYRASAWVRCNLARTIGLNIIWRDGGGAVLSTSTTSLAVSATTWTLLSFSASHATAVQAQVSVSLATTPPNTHLTYIDEARIRRAGDAGGMCFDVASPKGDIETPLNLAITTAGVVATGRRRTMLAVRRRGTPSATAIVLQAEDMTQGTATSTQPNSALMSGPTGNNFSRITFAGSAAMTQRLTGTFPPTASVDARGTYRVMARVRQNTTTDTFALRLRWGGTDVQRTGTTVSLPVDTGGGAPTVKYIELDTIQVPVDYDPVYRGPSGVELAVEGLFVALDAQRVTGAGTLDVDLLLFIPADDTLEMITWPAAASAPVDYMAMGGTQPAAYARGAAGQVISTEAIEIAGQGLMISPGRANRIFVARDTGTGTALTGAGDDITGSVSLTPSYFPRYLSPVRPVSS